MGKETVVAVRLKQIVCDSKTLEVERSMARLVGSLRCRKMGRWRLAQKVQRLSSSRYNLIRKSDAYYPFSIAGVGEGRGGRRSNQGQEKGNCRRGNRNGRDRGKGGKLAIYKRSVSF